MALVEHGQRIAGHVDVDDVLEDIGHVIEEDARMVVVDKVAVGVGGGGEACGDVCGEGSEGAFGDAFGGECAAIMCCAYAADGLPEEVDKFAACGVLHFTQRRPGEELRGVSVLYVFKECLGDFVV